MASRVLKVGSFSSEYFINVYLSECPERDLEYSLQLKYMYIYISLLADQFLSRRFSLNIIILITIRFIDIIYVMNTLCTKELSQCFRML